MYAVMGITGQVGGAVARRLLATGHEVRAIVRSADRGVEWASRGCEIVVADMGDAGALREAFTSVEGVFVMLPSNFDPSRGYLETHALVASIGAALDVARPPKVVCLSTIGAQVARPNLLRQLSIMERSLGALSVPVAFVRAAWFMENAAWDVEPAMTTGVVPTFLQPLDKAFPMIATDDVGRVSADVLLETWTGCRVIELEGTRRISPNEIAAGFSRVLGRKVTMQPVPRDTWETLFVSQGAGNPEPRMQMLDGFNAGWIEFERVETESRRGRVPLEQVLRQLVARREGELASSDAA